MSSNKKLVRKRFRDSVFERDGYKCRSCGKQGIDRQGSDGHLKYHKSIDPVDLDAHHITNRTEFVNGGYVQSNGISVCPNCHEKAELFHIMEGLEWEPNFHPDDLYKLIGSNFEKAQKDDARNK